MTTKFVGITALAVLTALTGCAGSFSGEKSDSAARERSTEFGVADVGRNAAIVLLSDLQVQDLLRKGENNEALRVLDSAYLLQIALLKEFDHDLSNDERHIRLRNKAVEKLKRMWLDHPPEYLDENSVNFIETTCAKVPGCPPGKLIGRKPLPAGPR